MNLNISAGEHVDESAFLLALCLFELCRERQRDLNPQPPAPPK